MTIKRFTDIWCSETEHIGLTDNGIDKEFTGSEFEDFLNELHEKNEQLTKQLQTEHTMLDNAILLERTRMGQNSLKQYRDAIK